MDNESGDFATDAGSVHAFLNSPDKFPGRITADDGTKQWIVANEDELRQIRSEVDAYCERGKRTVKVESNVA